MPNAIKVFGQPRPPAERPSAAELAKGTNNDDNRCPTCGCAHVMRRRDGTRYCRLCGRERRDG